MLLISGRVDFATLFKAPCFLEFFKLNRIKSSMSFVAREGKMFIMPSICRWYFLNEGIVGLYV